MEELITVIIAIYNGEKYLAECIQSVVEQDYENLEIILIDDGSTDRSGEIIDKYANMDSRIIVVHQANSGVSRARNTAIDMSTGGVYLYC
ncbi:MAG: glycosyltransferase [Acetatifactor muris]|nr:glycosyltransferase [Acetatifactor muris]